MYGTFSGMSFGLVGLVAVMVIGLALFASPLIAVGIAIVAAVFLLVGMSALRQRSARHDDSTRTRRSPGEPASGEG
jgi:membrane protein implicated in regulation of membrane protease activity